MKSNRFVMVREGSPCLECPKKGCGSFHDECDKYIAFREKCKRNNQAERREKSKLGFIEHRGSQR